MRKFIYYLEMILGAMSMLFIFCAAIMVMFCFIREDFKFAWVSTTFALLSLSSILMKIFLFND